tara:strand:- start:953 stop:1171 length:219 start_codon:yes stop_codon:yes gene_type:complete
MIPNKGGRPKKYGQDTVRVSLRIPADVIAAINAISDDRSECIVSILQQWKNQSTDCRILAFNEWWAKQYANK